MEYAHSVWCPYKKCDITDIEKVQKRATKLIIKLSLKNRSYKERLKILNLPTLKYRRLRGDMIDVFKIANNMYDASSVPVLPFDITRGNCFKLSNQRIYHDVRKYSFIPRIIYSCSLDIWNSLPDFVVNIDSINIFKSRLDKYWINQDIVFDYTADLA